MLLSTTSVRRIRVHVGTVALLLLFLQSALQPLWVLACQLSLSILSRKVFTECRCQQHVKPPTWKTSDKNVPTPATRRPSRLKRRERTPAAEGGTMGEKIPRILPKVATFTSLLGSFTCRKFATSPPKEGVLRIFSPEKSDVFGRV